MSCCCISSLIECREGKCVCVFGDDTTVALIRKFMTQHLGCPKKSIGEGQCGLVNLADFD